MTAVSEGRIRELERLQGEYLKLVKKDETLARMLVGREGADAEGWELRGADRRMTVRGQDVSGKMAKIVREYGERRGSLVTRLAWLIGELGTVRPFGKDDGEAMLAIVNAQLKENGYPPIGTSGVGFEVLGEAGTFGRMSSAAFLRRETPGTVKAFGAASSFSAAEKMAYRKALRAYRRWGRTEELERLMLAMMTEALYRWTTKLGGGKTMTLKRWARENGMSVNAVRNRARRGTIPAFRENGRWVVGV